MVLLLPGPGGEGRAVRRSIEAARLFLLVADAMDARQRTGADPIKQVEGTIRWPALLEKREAVRAMMEEVIDETIPLLVEKFVPPAASLPTFSPHSSSKPPSPTIRCSRPSMS